MASLADAFAGIESSGNPLAWNTLPGGRRSRYRGLFQFGPDQERRYGITDWTNPDQQRRAFEQHVGSLRGDLSRRLGRAPADWELYFGHQQGPSGSAALLGAAPGTPAWRAIRQYYGSDVRAQQAIAGNIPRGHALYGRPADSITADEFAQMWQARFGRQQGRGAPMGAPMVSPVLGAGMGAPTVAPTPASDTGQSWLSAIGRGLGAAFGIGSAEAGTPQTVPPDFQGGPLAGPGQPPQAPPLTGSMFQGSPLTRGLPQPPSSLVPLLEGLGLPLPGNQAGKAAGPPPPSWTGEYDSPQTPTPPPAPPVPPFGAPTVTPEPGLLGHPMGPSELQPVGRDITREMVEGGLPQAPPPPVDADAIMRGAETAAADRASQPPQPGYFERLMQNPAFLAGLSILGTAPGGNWGPNAVQAMTSATRAGREQTEYQRLQARRAVQDRVWREAFGANGQPNTGHPLLQGMPPEMAATIFAMGAEEGLPAAQRWQMFRGQQAEQQRLREANLAMFGLGPQQTSPQGGGDDVAVLTGDRLRTGAGLGAIEDTSGISAPAPSTGAPLAPPPGSGMGIAQPPLAPTAPPTAPPQGGQRAEPTVTIGNRTLPVSTARALATTLPDGPRHVVEQAIAAAEREAQPPEAIRTRAIQTDQAYRILTGALEDYTKLVERTGAVVLPGQDRDAVNLARTNILLQLKELYNLGVLNGPDLSLMESMVYDPTIGISGSGPFGAIPGISGWTNAFTNPAERARTMTTRLMGELLRIRNNTASLAGMPPIQPGSGAQTPPGGGQSGQRPANDPLGIR